MKCSISARPEPLRGLTNAFNGRTRAIRDADDSDLYTDLGSELSATDNLRHAGQSEESFHGNSDDRGYEEIEVSGTLSKARSR